MRKSLSITLAIVVISLHTLAEDLPSAEELFRAPQFTQPSLSMDGKYFVARYTEKDQVFLWSRNLDSTKAGFMRAPQDCDIYDYDWVSNESIIYDLSRKKQWVETLGVVDRELRSPKTIIKMQLVSVVDGLIHDPKHALVFLRNNVKNNIDTEALYTLDIKTGVYGQREGDFPGRVLGWTTDRYGVPRLVRVYRKGQEGKVDHYYRKHPGSSWEKLNLGYSGDCSIHGFTPDGEGIYISAYTGKNTASLSIFDLNHGEILQEVYNHPRYDFDDATLYFFGSPHFSSDVSLKGARFQDQTVWFDERIRSVQETIDKRLVGSRNHIIDADTGLTRFLITSYADIVPKQYLLYDRSDDQIKLVAETRRWIDYDALCQTQEFTFESTDGLKLQGYFTRPNSASAPYPTVVLLHGGPHARDYWGFDPEVQFLATRGYAVLQVNYRGSTGFGRKVSFEPRFEYLKMHEDVTTATVYGIRSGLIDSHRVAIMGASFGGYLAICGAAFEPELYSCAITNVGVFDWEEQWKHFKAYSNSQGYDALMQVIKHQNKGEAYLKEASPIHQAHTITIPVLIAGGKNDRQVPITQSLRLAAIMKRAGNRPETYFKYGETHGFQFEKNRIEYYERVISFINRNIDKRLTRR